MFREFGKCDMPVMSSFRAVSGFPDFCSCLAHATHEAEWYLLAVTALLKSCLTLAWVRTNLVEVSLAATPPEPTPAVRNSNRAQD